MKLIKKQSVLSGEEILSKISAYDIYRYYFGDFTPNRKYLNHLRGDKKQPSFTILTKFNDLCHVDFGSDYWRGNCFNLVQQIYRCDYATALNIISKDFNLSATNVDKPSIITWEKPELVEKKKTVIQVITRKFTKDELEYWADYELGFDDIKDNVFAIDKLYINRERSHTRSELTFAYRFGDYWKIYRPFNKEFKWLTNCPIDVMYGLENITNCVTSVITKSVKDYLVCKKFITPCTAGVQNESSVAISDENIKYIKDNCKKPYVIFDNDAKGVESCTFYNRMGFEYWNVPKKYNQRRNITDPSDLVYWYGSKRLIEEVKKKIKC